MERPVHYALDANSVRVVFAGDVDGQHLDQRPDEGGSYGGLQQPTFSDALALVRRSLWSSCHIQMSPSEADIVKIPRSLFERITDAGCYAA